MCRLAWGMHVLNIMYIIVSTERDVCIWGWRRHGPSWFRLYSGLFAWMFWCIPKKPSIISECMRFSHIGIRYTRFLSIVLPGRHPGISVGSCMVQNTHISEHVYVAVSKGLSLEVQCVSAQEKRFLLDWLHLSECMYTSA